MVKISTQPELKEELSKTKTAMALFYANWCGYCMRFLPSFQQWVDGQKFEAVIYVVLDDYDSPLWDDFQISAAPSVIYFVDGKVSRRLDAKLGRGITQADFEAWIKDFKLQR
ncbi:MAG: thioredoxin family protein [Candidatus Bathyarchaeota archaeon]|nr:thioredoxin family protein [Candidatus Bathyarchaeota archaeon]